MTIDDRVQKTTPETGRSKWKQVLKKGTKAAVRGCILLHAATYTANMVNDYYWRNYPKNSCDRNAKNVECMEKRQSKKLIQKRLQYMRHLCIRLDKYEFLA